MGLFATSCSGCGRRIESGSVCSACAAKPRPSWDPPRLPRPADQARREHYQTPEYRANRKLAIERAGGHCEGCGCLIGRGEFECDHVAAIVDWKGRSGSVDDLSNLEILCTIRPGRCHQRKTAADRRARRQG